MRLPKTVCGSEESSNDAQTRGRSRSCESITQAVVVDQTRSQLRFWCEAVDGVYGVSDLIDDLEIISTDLVRMIRRS